MPNKKQRLKQVKMLLINVGGEDLGHHDEK